MESGEGGREEEEVEAESEGEAGERKPERMQDPKRPSEAEVKEHELTHLPYRSWCRHCVRGRGKALPHRSLRDEAGMAEIHVDLCFLGEESEPGKTVPVLVARERTTRMTMAAVVPSKSTNAHIAKRLVAFMREVGVATGDLLVKADQEPAIQSILDAAGKHRAAAADGGGGRYVVEQSPAGSSQSNGIIERAIQAVEQQVRVMRSSLEDKWKVKVGVRHAVVPWMVEYAAVLLNRFEVSHDGKTAFERAKGRRARTLGIEFGEAVLWRRKPMGGALGKFACMWEDGIYLGLRGSSGELIVSDASGVWRTRSVRRRPEQDRWREDGIQLVRWVPWATREEDPAVDGERFEVTKLTEQEVVEERTKKEQVPLRFYIKKADLEQHGFSARCPGCKALLRGTARQGHSEDCRRRLAEAMAGEDKVVANNRKFDEFVARRLEEQDAKRRKTCSAQGPRGAGDEEGNEEGNEKEAKKQ